MIEYQIVANVPYTGDSFVVPDEAVVVTFWEDTDGEKYVTYIKPIRQYGGSMIESITSKSQDKEK